MSSYFSLRCIASTVGALAAVGCVSDFSPDPIKGSQNLAPAYDGGPGPQDAGAAQGGSPRTGAVSDADLPSSTADRDAEPAPSGGTCDLTGRWVMTERAHISAYGAQQVTVSWFYVELRQDGDALVVNRSMLCGGATDSPPGEAFDVHMDDSRTWPAYQRFANYDGRKGSATARAAECAVSFEPATLVRGMTVDHYKDLSVPLPTLDQREDGATPGWADWDNDGNPGYSMVVTGVVSGTLYSVVRATTTSLSGTFEPGARLLHLDDYTWKQQRVVLGTKEPDPLGIFGSPAERNPQPGLNFVELGRLAVDEATGDDDAVCAAVRTLAPTLNPGANAK